MCNVEIFTSCISMSLSFLFAMQPVGVVGAITPWNFPLAMITRKVSSNAVHFVIGNVKKGKDKSITNAVHFCIYDFFGRLDQLWPVAALLL